VYLGIDLGTGSVKTMLLDGVGNERSASRTYPVEAPESGRAESDTERWLAAIAAALGELGDLSRVRAIGLSGQMHGIVPVRRGSNGVIEPLHPAILWADGRATAELELYNSLPPGTRRRIANQPAAGMAGPTLAWLHRHRPDILRETEAVLLPKDYIRAALTGNLGTDHSDASGTLLYDFELREWDHSVIDALGLDRSIFPPIAYAVERSGSVTAVAAARFGVPEGVPVAFGAGDTPAAMYGTALTDPGIAQVSVGTAAQISRPVAPGEALTAPSSLSLFEGAEPSLRYRVAAMLNGGLALEWVRGRLGFEWKELYARIGNTPLDDPGELHFLPYLTGERTPHMNPGARGAWLGLSLHHDSDTLARAALLGVACTVRLGIETLEEHLPPAQSIRLVGGSARHAAWRRILSAMLARPLSYSEQADSSARGAAWMAAVMIGDTPPPGPTFEEEDLVSAAWADAYYLRFLDLYHRLNG
jgi:xylulokinase